MMPKFCCVLFSYNRAILLDLTLRSLVEKMMHPDIAYTVVYHCTAAHRKSYDTLLAEWQPKGIRFVHRDERPRAFSQLTNFLVRPTNLYRYLRKPKMRRFIDNFKDLVEGAIRDSAAPFTFFSTDDQYVLSETYIPNMVLERIKADPRHCSYRMGLSDQFTGQGLLPADLQVERLDYSENGREGTALSWDATAREATKFWEYSFNVDFQVYDSAALLEFLSPILYHMPTTLEAFGVKESRSRNYFRKQLGTTERTVVGVQANNVQTMVNNPEMGYSPEELRDMYDLGYRLVVRDSQISPEKFLFMPETLFLRKLDDPSGELFEFRELTQPKKLA
jgi:hypothetical protein